MSAKTDSLRDIYLDVAGEETITERQQEDPSRDPIEGSVADLEREVRESARQDGLDEAVDDLAVAG